MYFRILLNQDTLIIPPLVVPAVANLVLMSMHNFAHLLPPSWTTQIGAWLAEDTPSFDYAGYVVGETERDAFLFGKGKHTAVLAGVPFFTEIFRQLGCQCVPFLSRSFDSSSVLTG